MEFEKRGEELIYEEMMKSLGNIDLTKVIELQDNTNLTSEAACGGGACEIDTTTLVKG